MNLDDFILLLDELSVLLGPLRKQKQYKYSCVLNDTVILSEIRGNFKR